MEQPQDNLTTPEQSGEATIEITQDAITPYIVRIGKEFRNFLKQKEAELGPRYNRRNSVQLMFEEFGAPDIHPEIFFKEGVLIANKQSKLRPAIRYVVKDIFNRAISMYLLERN